MKPAFKPWPMAVLLTAPMLVFFLIYLFNHEGFLSPTGFIQYDNVSYIAYARQYIEPGATGLLYSNPFNDGPGYPGIYFQPQTIFFAFLLKAGIPPGWILIPFTLLCSVTCFRLLIGIYDFLYPASRHRALMLWALCWGGGLLTLAGYILFTFSGISRVDNIFFLDPAGGWWGLNWGRSLFFSCEAWYHALFLGVVSSLLYRKWTRAFLLAIVLSVSHPFTGVELLLIVCAWSVAELLAAGRKQMPAWFPVAVLLLLSLHVFYYLYFLNQYPEHRSVSEQYALNWRLRFFSMIPAYIITGGLALYTVMRIDRFRFFFRQRSNRLFLCWFIVAFGLANHELFTRPMQPLHFTRGYIWTALFFIGLPALHLLTERWNTSGGRKILLIAFFLLFFSDNASWILSQLNSRGATVSTSYTSAEEKEVFSILKGRASQNTLLIGNDAVIPYMSTVYTDVHPWIAHPYTTPFAQQKAEAWEHFISSGLPDPSWQERDLIFLFHKNDSVEMRRAAMLPFKHSLLAETQSYQLIQAWVP